MHSLICTTGRILPFFEKKIREQGRGIEREGWGRKNPKQPPQMEPDVGLDPTTLGS